MNVMKLSILAILACGLSACGSGGDNYSLSAGSSSTTSSGTSSGSGSTSSGGSSSGSSSNGNSSGATKTTIPVFSNVVSISPTGELLSLQRDGESESINTIVINGQSISILPSGISGNSWLDTPTWVTRNNLKNARWGYIRLKNSDNVYLMANGKLTSTENMPTTGTYQYKGYAIYVDKNNLNGPHKANMDMKASFADKTISGKISSINEQNKAFDDVSFSGAIFSNKFGAVSDGTEVNGAFYGDKAEESAGTFHNETKGFGGSFGVSQQ